MTDSNKLKYKSCREQAGLTQEQAITLLGIADTGTLSRYENGHTPVPQDLAAAMVKVYQTQTLAWWHIRYTNPDLAPFLPEPPKMITDGDMMLKIELAGDDIAAVRCALKSILRGSLKSCEEAEKMQLKAHTFRSMASKFMEIAGYLEERNK